jgi:4-hydroxy-2-oxoheptanedioate aldolase
MQTPLKTQLAEGKPGLGFWLTYVLSPCSYDQSRPLTFRYPSAPLAKSIIHGGGFNWVLIDGEHGLINDSNYYEVS